MKKQPVVDAGKEHHEDPHDDVDQRAAKVLFEYDRDDRRRNQKGLEHTRKLRQLVAVLRQITCHDEHKRNFDELRWLQRGDAEVNPGAGTVVFLTEPRDIYRQQEQDRNDIEHLFQPDEEPIVEILDEKQDTKAEHIGDGLNQNRSGEHEPVLVYGAYEHGQTQRTQ